ncbi:cyanophycinase [bacterium]|nr:cyanophycinase [bacterium]
MSSIRSDQAHYTSYFSGNSGPAQAQGQGGTVLMGGGDDVDEAFRFLVGRGGGGDVLVLRASGADGYNDYLMQLTHPNSVESVVFSDREASFLPEIERKIDQAESIFLAGGDQSKYLSYWRDTPVQAALQRAILRGVPLGGTSAGLAVLGDRIFAAHQGGLDSDEVLADPTRPDVTLEKSFLELAHMERTLTDTHFSQRERMGRLLGFLAQANQGQSSVTRGLGVDEATAVLLQPDGQARVVGTNSAYFVTPGGPAEVFAEGQPLTYRDLKVLRLDPGQSIDMASWTTQQGEATTVNVVEGEVTSAR